MTYSPTTWVNGTAPALDATHLNNLEAGVVAAALSADVGNAVAATLTNKRVTRRAPTVTQSATPAINTDLTDVVHIVGLAQAITSMTSGLTGTPVQGDTLRIDITDDGTARAITWGTSFEAGAAALPTTTAISTRLDVSFVWNTVTSKWRCVAADTTAALALKADLAGPTFTGTPTLPTGTIATTQTVGDSSTKLATTAFVATGLALKKNKRVVVAVSADVPTPLAAADTEYIYLITGAHTFTLPTAVGNTSQYVIKACQASGTTLHIVTTSSQTIDAQAVTTQFDLGATSYGSIRVVSDNANWWVTGV